MSWDHSAFSNPNLKMNHSHTSFCISSPPKLYWLFNIWRQKNFGLSQLGSLTDTSEEGFISSVNGRNRDRLSFLGLQITSDSDCSHEIKRHFFPGRKARTNLDKILKCRDITLPTKVRLVKAMFFPVAMYGCETWTIKKAEEIMLLNCGAGKDSWDSLGQ